MYDVDALNPRQHLIIDPTLPFSLPRYQSGLPNTPPLVRQPPPIHYNDRPSYPPVLSRLDVQLYHTIRTYTTSGLYSTTADPSFTLSIVDNSLRLISPSHPLALMPHITLPVPSHSTPYSYTHTRTLDLSPIQHCARTFSFFVNLSSLFTLMFTFSFIMMLMSRV